MSERGKSEPAQAHGLSLEQHAELSARIAEQPEAHRELLEDTGLTEEQWVEATSFWMQQLAEDVTANGVQARMPIQYSDAFARAQDALASLVAMEPEAFAELVVEIQQLGSVVQPLAQRSLSNPDYLRLARHFAKVLSSDPVMAKRFNDRYQQKQPATKPIELTLEALKGLHREHS